jgi:hypothetical protein
MRFVHRFASAFAVSLVLFVGVASAQDAPAPAAPASASAPVGDARAMCTAAMRTDPKLAADIVKIADERAQVQRDKDTIAAHEDAFKHIQKNEQHVIIGYAAMWIVAALFVVFLWRRQQALTAEIGNLRRDLEAAAEVPPGKGHA